MLSGRLFHCKLVIGFDQIRLICDGTVQSNLFIIEEKRFVN